MKKRFATHDTFVIERRYPSPPERAFAAFSDPVKKQRWLAAGEESTIEEFEMDFQVGGRERVQFRGKNGMVFVNESVYRDILPNERIVIAYNMSVGDKRISSSLATTEFVAEKQGTLLIFTEQAAFFEGADGPEIREAGWQALLKELAKELA